MLPVLSVRTAFVSLRRHVHFLPFHSISTASRDGGMRGERAGRIGPSSRCDRSCCTRFSHHSVQRVGSLYRCPSSPGIPMARYEPRKQLQTYIHTYLDGSSFLLHRRRALVSPSSPAPAPPRSLAFPSPSMTVWSSAEPDTQRSGLDVCMYERKFARPFTSLFSFCLIILAFSLCKLWRHVAKLPFALHPGLSQ